MNSLRNLTWKETAFLILIVLMTLGMLAHGYMHGADFHVFYVAGLRVLDHQPIYQASDGWMPFKYHPAWAGFFALGSWMPEKLFLTLFNIVHLAVWWNVAYRVAAKLSYNLSTWRAKLIITILSLSALSAEIGYGQINGFIFLGILIVFELLEGENNHPIKAGVIVALLTSIKLNFGLLLVYAFIKSPRTLIGFIFGILALHLAVVIWFQDPLGTELYKSWVDLLLDQSSSQFTLFEAQGFLRFFMEISESLGKYLWLTWLIIFCLIAAVLNRAGSGKCSFNWPPRIKEIAANYVGTPELCVWLAAIYLFSPLAWWYQLLFMFPLGFYLWKQPLSKLERKLVIACFFVYGFITYNTLGHDGIIVFKTYMGFYFASDILLIILGLRILQRVSVLPSSIR
ncbi:MAG: glycosyltransferase family 87 protein [Bdellovibrionota bacterium]